MDVAGMRVVRSALVFARDLSGRSGISRRAGSGELLRISSGVYLEAKALEGLERWQQAEFIYCARLHAVCAKRGSAVLCGQSAAFVHGLPMVEMGEVACYSISAHGQSAMRLPAVRIPNSIVVKGLAVRPSRSAHGGRIVEAAGLRVTDPLETALECAFGEHEETAFVQTCSALHLFSGFSRFNADSRDGAERLRQHLLEGMAALPLVRKMRANGPENAGERPLDPGERRPRVRVPGRVPRAVRLEARRAGGAAHSGGSAHPWGCVLHRHRHSRTGDRYRVRRTCEVRGLRP